MDAAGHYDPLRHHPMLSTLDRTAIAIASVNVERDEATTPATTALLLAVINHLEAALAVAARTTTKDTTMDPDAAYAIAFDTARPTGERQDAASSLIEWLDHGGFIPEAWTGTRTALRGVLTDIEAAS